MIEKYLKATKFNLKSVNDDNEKYRELFLEPLLNLIREKHDVDIKIIPISCDDHVSEGVFFNKKNYIIYNTKINDILYIINYLISEDDNKYLSYRVICNLISRKLLSMGELASSWYFSMCYIDEDIIKESKNGKVVSKKENFKKYLFPQILFIIAHELTHILLSNGVFDKESLLVERKNIMSYLVSEEANNEVQWILTDQYLTSSFFSKETKKVSKDNISEIIKNYKKNIVSRDILIEEIICDDYARRMTELILFENSENSENSDYKIAILKCSLALRSFSLINAYCRILVGNKYPINNYFMFDSSIRYLSLMNNLFGKPYIDEQNIHLKKLNSICDKRIIHRIFSLSKISPKKTDDWEHCIKNTEGTSFFDGTFLEKQKELLARLDFSSIVLK